MDDNSTYKKLRRININYVEVFHYFSLLKFKQLQTCYHFWLCIYSKWIGQTSIAKSSTKLLAICNVCSCLTLAFALPEVRCIYNRVRFILFAKVLYECKAYIKYMYAVKYGSNTSILTLQHFFVVIVLVLCIVI